MESVPHIDFMRYDPSGKFYLRRAFEDDLVQSTRGIEPFTVIDFPLQILRIGETIAVGLALAKAMGAKPDETSLSYIFAWRKLRGRTLTSWANPSRMMWSGRSDRDEVQSYIEAPLDLPLSRLGSITKQALDPLSDAFDANIGQDVFDDLTTRLVTRTLRN